MIKFWTKDKASILNNYVCSILILDGIDIPLNIVSQAHVTYLIAKKGQLPLNKEWTVKFEWLFLWFPDFIFIFYFMPAFLMPIWSENMSRFALPSTVMKKSTVLTILFLN